VPELSGSDLLREWRKVMDSMVSSAASVGSRAEIPRQLLEPMQRQLELMQDVIERERRVQKQLAGLVFGPVDTIFQLLEETGTMLRSQAQELEAAGRALEHTAGLMKTQAELFERSIGAVREPVDLARAATGLERRARKSSARQPRRTPPRK
jgi:hypothetical protein